MWKELEVSLHRVERERLKEKPASERLGFGVHFTDHMFVMKWTREQGWHDARITAFEDFSISPAAMVFHYGQAIFEGMKAYRGKDGQLLLFRPKDNFERLNTAAVRMCMPRVPVEKMVNVLKSMVYLEREWVPRGEGESLYIRPTMIAAEPYLGVRPAGLYYFYIIMSPVGAYYPEGCNPTRIFVSEQYSRAVKGGVGYVKTAGNYAASLQMSEIAKKEGYTQVLWLDACEHRYVEEVGTSNIFFRIDNRLLTPPLAGSILGGITRDSVIKLAGSWGVEVVERPITIDEVITANASGNLQEVFGTGTAAVISPVGELCYQGVRHVIGDGGTGEISARLYRELQAIQHGYQDDPHKWTVRVG